MASRFGNKLPLMLLAIILAMAHRISYPIAATETELSASSDDATMKARHEKWMAEHGRTYEDAAEKARRFQVFKANAEFVDRANAAGDTNKHVLATNEFADMTGGEFVARYTGLIKPTAVASSGFRKLLSSFFNYDRSEREHVDWRHQGAVTGVKKQGGCRTPYTHTIHVACTIIWDSS